MRSSSEGRMSVRRALATGGAAAALAASAAGTAAASETVAYGYDGRGRLVKVERTGTVNSNVTTGYAYDKADNRLSRSTATPIVFSIADASVTEGNFILFTVSKSGQTGQACTIVYSSADGTATHPADYNGGGNILNFAANEASKIVSFTVHADGIAEGNETMRVLLSSPGCGASIGDGEAIGTISDP